MDGGSKNNDDWEIKGWNMVMKFRSQWFDEDVTFSLFGLFFCRPFPMLNCQNTHRWPAVGPIGKWVILWVKHDSVIASHSEQLRKKTDSSRQIPKKSICKPTPLEHVEY